MNREANRCEKPNRGRGGDARAIRRDNGRPHLQGMPHVCGKGHRDWGSAVVMTAEKLDTIRGGGGGSWGDAHSHLPPAACSNMGVRVRLAQTQTEIRWMVRSSHPALPLTPAVCVLEARLHKRCPPPPLASPPVHDHRPAQRPPPGPTVKHCWLHEGDRTSPVVMTVPKGSA